MSVKHDFISGQVKQIPTEEGRNAELALYRRRPDEAEAILIQVTSGQTLSVWIMWTNTVCADNETCILTNEAMPAL